MKLIDESPEQDQYEYSIEDARDTLDRIIGFVGNCDTKASIMLGVLGFILTSAFTNSMVPELFLMIKEAANYGTAFSVIYLILLFISIAIFIFGIFLLISVLIAKSGKSNNDSKIFFSDIALNNKDSASYKDKVLNQLECDVKNDLIAEIYINAVICYKKFRKHNLGLKLVLLGAVLFVVLFITGLLMLGMEPSQFAKYN